MPAPAAAFRLCFGLWFPAQEAKGFTFVPLDLSSLLLLEAGGSLCYYLAYRDTGPHLCRLVFPEPPVPWASSVHILYSAPIFSGLRNFSFPIIGVFNLSLTIHVISFEARQRKYMHVTPSPSLPRTCGFSNREFFIPGIPTTQSLLPEEPVRSPHGGLTGPTFTGSSLQSHPGATSPRLPGITVTGSLISSTLKCLEKSLYFWKPQR